MHLVVAQGEERARASGRASESRAAAAEVEYQRARGSEIRMKGLDLASGAPELVQQAKAARDAAVAENGGAVRPVNRDGRKTHASKERPVVRGCPAIQRVLCAHP